MLTPAETAKGACLHRHSPSVKSLEFLIRRGMTMMRPKGPANQIGSDVYACLAESESGVRYRPRPAGRHPRASPPSSSLSPVGKVYGISDLSVLSCGPNAFHDGGPSGAAERAHALPWQPFTSRTRFLFVCVLYPTRRSNLSMRRPKFKLRCQNSAESRTTTRRCSQSV